MRTVLLVDDCSVARRVLARRLTTEGFAVQEAASVADARSAADAGAFACAIFDLELADGDGAALAESLVGRRASLPVAFFTAGAALAVRDRARAQGPVFDKPDVEAIIAWATRAVQPPPTK
jgi:DNA-binding NtrC family response regulator